MKFLSFNSEPWKIEVSKLHVIIGPTNAEQLKYDEEKEKQKAEDRYIYDSFYLFQHQLLFTVANDYLSFQWGDCIGNLFKLNKSSPKLIILFIFLLCRKTQQLEELEDKWHATQSSTPSSFYALWNSYSSSIVTKIIENLQVIMIFDLT